RRGKNQPEYELLDTGAFWGDRYFDVFVEYAKAASEDILINITAINRGPDVAPLHLLPTVWFRNTWSWTDTEPRPMLRNCMPGASGAAIEILNPTYGQRWLYCDGSPEVLFTENETNMQRIYGSENP